MREGYTEAEIESPDGMIIAVKVVPGHVTRHTFFVPKGGFWSNGTPFSRSREEIDWTAIESDLLADIIVRGIRSLEEERDIRCSKDPAETLIKKREDELRERLSDLLPWKDYSCYGFRDEPEYFED